MYVCIVFDSVWFVLMFISLNVISGELLYLDDDAFAIEEVAHHPVEAHKQECE